MEDQSIAESRPSGDVQGAVDEEPVCDAAVILPCTRAAIRLFSGKWKGEILLSLQHGRLRFGQLMRAIPGITQHMLTTQLRDLERHGLVTRTVFAEVPPRVEYELTAAARDLRPVFDEIVSWARRHEADIGLVPEPREDRRPRR